MGAAYEERPKKDTPITSLQIKKRELVFDLDLTDYNDIRDCGESKSHYCRECWPFIRKAALFIHETLREDFGFATIKWFFSGRRGLHGWVLGEKSQNLDKSVREAVVEYISPKKRMNLSKRFQMRVLRILGEAPSVPPQEDSIEKIYQKLPRIDRKVTIDLHRLMRVPGSLHQATGRPNTQVRNLEDFYPDSVSSIEEII